jgi:membrane associated rhomboid family serine protease
MPPATGSLIVACVLGFLLQLSFEPSLTEAFALWVDPESPIEQVLSAPWQLVTYSFLHGSGLHLALNLFALWMFGADVERIWGTKRYLAAYFSAVICGAAAQIVAVTVSGDAGAPMIGASGGVFGILLCFGMLFPKRRILLLFPPIPMQARTFVFVYAALELFLGVTGTAEGVAHFAHLGGLVGGWLVYRYGASLSASS